MLIAVCVLNPAHLEHVLGFTSFRFRFGGVLRGRFVPRTWFDRVPAGTVLPGTRLFRTRSDYKKWCVPRTCSRWNCTENKCERPVNGLRASKRTSNFFSQRNWLALRMIDFEYVRTLIIMSERSELYIYSCSNG